ncbi:MAG: type I-E CRISPR-associated protein Cse2/CasB [Lachnospiraceae bacterium]|nr:type I-E CRISPR-associated protein Cse2/CasB [Lachnospiraceae bacterium]
MSKEKVIGKSVSSIIVNLYSQLDYSSGKAKLAKLRSSIGKSDLVETYPFLFEMIPEELLGHSAILSDEEKAIIWSLQLYALLQQGRSDLVQSKLEAGQNFGSSLSMFRSGGDSGSVDRRFNAMILAETEEEFQMHLRYMFRLYKSKIKSGTVDFAKLAMDIYRFIHWEDGKERIRLTWSREYYRVNSKGEENND